MARPLIGITVDTSHRPDQYESPMAYSTAVEKAGGLALLLPYKSDPSLIPRMIDILDGLLLSGGHDLDPHLYDGGDYHPNAEPIDPDRQRFELKLLAEVERRRKPVLGVCLGSQLMNVHRGGTLHQFLPEMDRTPPIEHRKIGNISPRHAVQVDADSVIGRLLGKSEIEANTSHKQSVSRPGRGLRVVATAPDGVVEAIDDPNFPLFLGVQWHPERLHEERDHLALFKLLVEKAEQDRASRASSTKKDRSAAS